MNNAKNEFVVAVGRTNSSSPFDARGNWLAGWAGWLACLARLAGLAGWAGWLGWLAGCLAVPLAGLGWLGLLAALACLLAGWLDSRLSHQISGSGGINRCSDPSLHTRRGQEDVTS